MIAVLFEVYPYDGQYEQYLEIAARLKSHLEQIDGFISVERFKSLSDSKKILSLSFWRDEEAVCRWRKQEDHAAAQCQGRQSIFSRYRIRTAQIVRDREFSRSD